MALKSPLRSQHTPFTNDYNSKPFTEGPSSDNLFLNSDSVRSFLQHEVLHPSAMVMAAAKSDTRQETGLSSYGSLDNDFMDLLRWDTRLGVDTADLHAEGVPPPTPSERNGQDGCLRQVKKEVEGDDSKELPTSSSFIKQLKEKRLLSPVWEPLDLPPAKLQKLSSKADQPKEVTFAPDVTTPKESASSARLVSPTSASPPLPPTPAVPGPSGSSGLLTAKSSISNKADSQSRSAGGQTSGSSSSEGRSKEGGGGGGRKARGVQRMRFTSQQQERLRMFAEAVHWNTAAVDLAEDAALEVCRQVGIDMKQLKKWLGNHRPKALRPSGSSFSQDDKWQLPPPHSTFSAPYPFTPPAFGFPAHLPTSQFPPPPFGVANTPPFNSLLVRQPSWGGAILPEPPVSLPPLPPTPEPLPWEQTPPLDPPHLSGSLPPPCNKLRLKGDPEGVKDLVRVWIEARVKTLTEKRLADGARAEGVPGGDQVIPPDVLEEVMREAREVTKKVAVPSSRMSVPPPPRGTSPCSSPAAPGVESMFGDTADLWREEDGPCVTAGGLPMGYVGKGAESQLGAVLFEKVLTLSDTSHLGRIILPKGAANQFLPPVEDREGLRVPVEDKYGGRWYFRYRFWPNNNSRMYVFEHTQDFIKQHQLEPGDTLVFYRAKAGHLVVQERKKSGGPLSTTVSLESRAVSPDTPSPVAHRRSLAPEATTGHQVEHGKVAYQQLSREEPFNFKAELSELDTTPDELVNLPVVNRSRW